MLLSLTLSRNFQFTKSLEISFNLIFHAIKEVGANPLTFHYLHQMLGFY